MQFRLYFRSLNNSYLIKKLKTFFTTNPIYYFKSGYRRFKRYCVWFPVLWKDEDWEPEYLFEIMRFKISRMRKSIDKNKIHVGYEKNVRNMKIAEELLARIAFSDFYYNLSEQIEQREKNGKCYCPDETFTLVPDCSDINTRKIRYYRYFNLSCNYCKDTSKYWYKKEEIKKKEDLDFLFKHIKKHVQKWWD